MKKMHFYIEFCIILHRYEQKVKETAFVTYLQKARIKVKISTLYMGHS